MAFEGDLGFWGVFAISGVIRGVQVYLGFEKNQATWNDLNNQKRVQVPGSSSLLQEGSETINIYW